MVLTYQTFCKKSSIGGKPVNLLNIEIKNMEKSLENMLKFSYQSDIYDSRLSYAIETFRYHMGINIEWLKEINNGKGEEYVDS